MRNKKARTRAGSRFAWQTEADLVRRSPEVQVGGNQKQRSYEDQGIVQQSHSYLTLQLTALAGEFR